MRQGADRVDTVRASAVFQTPGKGGAVLCVRPCRGPSGLCLFLNKTCTFPYALSVRMMHRNVPQHPSVRITH